MDRSSTNDDVAVNAKNPVYVSSFYAGVQSCVTAVYGVF
jgi:hypothetical protein